MEVFVHLFIYLFIYSVSMTNFCCCCFVLFIVVVVFFCCFFFFFFFLLLMIFSCVFFSFTCLKIYCLSMHACECVGEDVSLCMPANTIVVLSTGKSIKVIDKGSKIIGTRIKKCSNGNKDFFQNVNYCSK